MGKLTSNNKILVTSVDSIEGISINLHKKKNLHSQEEKKTLELATKKSTNEKLYN